MSEPELAQAHCKPCEGGVPPLPAERIAELLKTLPGWEEKQLELRKRFRFRNYYETIAFVNAIAWISHQENHHPELEVGYNTCTVRYRTHAIDGLSENDFICAAKVDRLRGP